MLVTRICCERFLLKFFVKCGRSWSRSRWRFFLFILLRSIYDISNDTDPISFFFQFEIFSKERKKDRKRLIYFYFLYIHMYVYLFIIIIIFGFVEKLLKVSCKALDRILVYNCWDSPWFCSEFFVGHVVFCWHLDGQLSWSMDTHPSAK